MITRIILVCHYPPTLLFDFRSIFSYVSTYLATCIDGMCELLSMLISVSTPVDDFLVVD